MKTKKLKDMKVGDKFYGIGGAYNTECEVVEQCDQITKTRVVGESHIYHTMSGIEVRLVPRRE